MRPRRLFCVISLSILSSLLACENVSHRQTSLTIGAVFPLTGSLAVYGTYMKEGVELALDDALRRGLVHQDDVHLVIEDGEANPAKSVASFQKLVSIDDPVAVIPATSGVILAIKPMANRDKIVLINATAISTDIEDADDYLFSIIPNANIEGKLLAEFAFNSGKKRAGVLFRNDASGKSFMEVFEKRFRALGGTILYEDAHLPNETDFRPYITKLAHNNQVDILFMPSVGPEVATYLKQARQLGEQTQVLTYTPFHSPKNLEIAGAAANGVLFSGPVFDADSNGEIQDLRAKIAAKYGQEEINYYIASHYDAMMLLLTAISHGNRTGPAIKDYIARLKTYNGKSGLITFGPYGTATLPLRIYTVTEGKFVPYQNRPIQ